MKPATRFFTRGRVVLALAAAFSTAPVLAGGLREVDQKIFGMDCAPCAHGIEQGLKKLSGVTAVRVSLNEGKAVVSLAPDSRTTLAQIREVIRDNGFTPKDAEAKVAGRLVHEGERVWIDTGSGRFVVEGGKALPASAAGNDVALWVRIPETLTSPPTVQVIEREQKS